MTPDGQILTGQELPGGRSSSLEDLSAEDLFSTRPVATPADIRDELLAQMGHEVPRPPRPPDGPDVSELRERLGI
jgi:hypothetical protein